MPESLGQSVLCLLALSLLWSQLVVSEDDMEALLSLVPDDYLPNPDSDDAKHWEGVYQEFIKGKLNT